MTIKELYKWAIENGVENQEVFVDVDYGKIYRITRDNIHLGTTYFDHYYADSNVLIHIE